MSQLNLFDFTPPATPPALPPAALQARAARAEQRLAESEPPWEADEETAQAVTLTAHALARQYYKVTCALSFIGPTEYCHNCALFTHAESSPDSLKIHCKVGSYAEPDGRLKEGYALRPGHINQRGMSKIQWVKEVILTTASVRERPANPYKV